MKKHRSSFRRKKTKKRHGFVAPARQDASQPKVVSKLQPQIQQEPIQGIKPGGTAIVMPIPLTPGPLTEEVQVRESIHSCSTVTKHFKRHHYQFAVQGYARLGTLSSYKAREDKVQGLFGDELESLLVKRVSPPKFGTTFIDKWEIGVGSTSNISITTPSGVSPFEIHYTASGNAFCASVKNFDVERAARVQKAGNPKLSHFITYDLDLLISGIRYELHQRFPKRDIGIIVRQIDYKKEKLIIPNSHTISEAQETDVPTWIDACFTKPKRFSIEQEIRILVFDAEQPDRPLDSHDCIEITESPEIAKSILPLEHGLFPSK